MSTPTERATIYGTKRWRTIRNRAMILAGWLCERCAKQGRTEIAEAVHHILPIREGGDPWDQGNLQAVCRACHTEIHNSEHADSPTDPPAVREWRTFSEETI